MEQKHYVRLNEKSEIIKGFSDAFEQPEENDICINEEVNRHFELDGVLNPSLYDDLGCCFYKWINNELYIKSNEELNAEHQLMPDPPKTQLQLLDEDIQRNYEMMLTIGGIW